MNNRRRLLLKILLAFLATAFAGCASRRKEHEEWRESQQPYRYYEEEISSFMITKDGSKLVVITPSYHYIFSHPTNLIKALNAGFRHKLRMGFTAFVADDINGISGSMVLYFLPDTPEEEERGRKLGFYRVGSRPRVERSIRLVGKRFRASDIQLADKQRLKRSYQIKVQEPNPKFVNTKNSSGNIAMSPIEGAANGILLLVGLPLLIISMTGHCMTDEDCLK